MNEKIWWYLSRSSGIIALVLLVLSVVWGVLLATRALKPYDRPAWLLDLHKWLGGTALVMTGLQRITCPTLVVHARQDELTSLRSAHYLVEHIGAERVDHFLRLDRITDRFRHLSALRIDGEAVGQHLPLRRGAIHRHTSEQ